MTESVLSQGSAAARVDELRHAIEQHNYNYFVLDSPTVSDAEYDGLMRELRRLEEDYPELRSADSPTMHVGGDVAQGFKPHRHPRAMLSLANAFSHDELANWLQRVRKVIPNAAIDFVVEPKIDGLAIALTYDHGRFRTGATRGNGIEGENVTANLRTISDVPHRLHADDPPSRVEVRGEIYMSAAGFEQLNERRLEEGASLFANPRNSAAGSLRQLDPEVTRSRPLHLFAYAIGYVDGMQVANQWEALEWMRKWGFPVNPLVRHVSSVEDVVAFCERMHARRDELGYEIDGVVIKINSIALQEELGVVGREPRWALAYKFPPRQATTRLLSIDVNVGRTGSINPYAVLEPVNVGGVMVKLATLHNEHDIQRKDIRVGDRVIVQRAGDVIPQVVKPILEERDGTQQVYHLPDHCPACRTELIRPEGEAMARCPNIECPAQRFRWIEHFVSEPAMDIRGLGERMVMQFLDYGLIRNPADLYGLSEEQLLTIPKLQEKSASNILRAIEASKDRPLPNVTFALGIRYVGLQTADLLANAFNNLDAVLTASTEQLEAVEGIGSKTAEGIVQWTKRQQSIAFTEQLREAGVNWEQQRERQHSGPLDGVTMVITGRLETMSRTEAEARLKSLGARIASGMSKSVQYLIVGVDPGSKLEKARKLGTSVHDEQWLQKVLDTGAVPADGA